MKKAGFTVLIIMLIMSCSNTQKKEDKMHVNEDVKQKADEYITFKLTTDLSILTDKEKQMLPLLFEAAKIMDDIYWTEAFGDKDKLFSKSMDSYTWKFLNIIMVRGKD